MLTYVTNFKKSVKFVNTIPKNVDKFDKKLKKCRICQIFEKDQPLLQGKSGKMLTKNEKYPKFVNTSHSRI